MAAYVVRRLLALIPIFFGVSIFVFLLMRMLPGDVATMILMGIDEEGSSRVTSEAVDALREQLGLNAPLHVQYFEWIWGLLRLDGGTSLWTGRPVFEEIALRLPLTLELGLLALVLSLLIAIPVGIVAALQQDTWIDYLFRSFSVSGLAVPNFWLGALMILGLTVWFDWTPPLGYVELWQNPWTNVKQLIWPALVLGVSNAAIVARMTRSAMLEVMREDYVRTAWAKGLHRKRVINVHALRNALLPVITLIGIEIGTLISGTVVMETIFTLPGIGRYLIDAIFHRDYPVVQAIVLMFSLSVVIINLLTDLVYGALDPRIRYE